MKTRLEQLKERLQAYIDCEMAILAGAQSYQMGSRNLTRANLKEVSENIKYLEKEIAQAESKFGRNRMIGVIPRDL